MKEWIFTFGCGQELEGFFVRIKAETSEKAREKMVKHFGDNWAFQYTLKSWKKWEEEAKQLGIPLEEEILDM